MLHQIQGYLAENNNERPFLYIVFFVGTDIYNFSFR